MEEPLPLPPPTTLDPGPMDPNSMTLDPFVMTPAPSAVTQALARLIQQFCWSLLTFSETAHVSGHVSLSVDTKASVNITLEEKVLRLNSSDIRIKSDTLCVDPLFECRDHPVEIQTKSEVITENDQPVMSNQIDSNDNDKVKADQNKWKAISMVKQRKDDNDKVKDDQNKR